MIPYFTLPSFELFGMDIQPFFLLVTAGIVAGVLVYDQLCRNSSVIDRRTALHLPEILVLSGFIGAHLAHVLVYHPELMEDDPLVLLKFWGGLSSLGGFLGALAGGLVYVRLVKKQKLLPFADRLVVGLTVGWIFGRSGCATAHDHPGVHSDFPLAIKFPDGARHDLGFYELLLTIVIFGVQLFMMRKARRQADYLMVTLFMFAPARFLFDFLRAADVKWADARYFGLTFAQYSVIFLLAAAFWLLATRSRRPMDEKLSLRR